MVTKYGNQCEKRWNFAIALQKTQCSLELMSIDFLTQLKAKKISIRCCEKLRIRTCWFLEVCFFKGYRLIDVFWIEGVE
jgi:hypothetical protein